MAWEIVIGIETHAQLATKSKMFSGASTAFGAPPNTQASAVDLALPGTLPVANRAAVELAIRFGLLVGGPSAINRRSIFARKNYFYPDLPKGYQISQYEEPIVKSGKIAFLVNETEKTVRLTRAHLEEDAGKSLHEDFHGMTGIDLNRAGTPLLEIVSEPELRGSQEAVAYAKKLHEIVTWFRICDGNMQEGSFRCDANVSVRKAGDSKLGTRCEIKNLNSFLFMEQAIEFEAKRQIEILEAGGKIEQETRLYDPARNETRSMRSKEDAQDYRYFPDPDLLPLIVTEKMIEDVAKAMPASPEEKRRQFEQQWGIPAPTAILVTANRGMAEFFETTANSVVALSKFSAPKLTEVLTNTANVTVSSLSARVNNWDTALTSPPIPPKDFALIQVRWGEGTLSGRMVKEVIDAVAAGEGTPDEIIEKRGKQISDSGELEKLVDAAIAAGAKQVEDYRAGKEKALQSLVGQVMKASKGKANPAQVNEILLRKLKG
jgi:aspartyl-tRNA(Asn)/glutamyl-tRNA(Gln) amidotransferase subunit B